MKPFHLKSLALIFIFTAIFGFLQPASGVMAGANAAPVINIWYGENQSFGHHGQPQEQVNILGTVSDADGIDSLSLAYKLNGGAEQHLEIGPDTRRLQKLGDFNVELYYDELQDGDNTVVIIARDGTNQVSREVNVNKNIVPWSVHTYTVDWSTVTEINDLAQVVDGKWELTPQGVRTKEVGYDRLIAIGEMSWTNYEVTVPITVHGIDEEFGYDFPSNGPAVGLLLDWTGHTDSPVSGWQPRSGYLPYGAIGFYRWMSEANGGDHLRLYLNDSLEDEDINWALEFDVRYILKMRVENLPGQSYKLKIWQSGMAEPAAWNMSGQGGLSDPQSGSLMLIAHHVDVTYEDVTITALSSSTYTLSVNAFGSGSVTKNPQKASYSFGEQVTLTANSDSGWKFNRWSDGKVDNPRVVTMTGNISLTANFAPQLVVAANPTGGGSVARSPDRAAYSINEQVILTALANPGWTFTGWSGSPCTGISSSTCTVTMDGGRDITANFTQNQYHLSVSASEGGSVSLIPDKADYTYGEKITLTAKPSSRWSFAGWGGDISGSDNPREITISEDMSIEAMFIYDPFMLSEKVFIPLVAGPP